MRNDTNRRTLLSGVAGGLMAAFGGCLSRATVFGDETRRDERRYAVGSDTRLSVRNRNGSVTVAGDDVDEIAVDIEIRGPSAEAVEAVSVDAERNDGDLRLVTTAEGEFPDRTSVSLSIRCPEAVSVREIRTANGPIEVTAVAGDIALESENGPLTAREIRGTVSLSTSNGGITAREIAGIAGARTTNGPIEIDVPAIERDVDVRTQNGGIDVALAADLDASISARTTNGTVDLHGLDLSGAETGDGRVSGTLGDGTYDLSFETRNSSIDIRALD